MSEVPLHPWGAVKVKVRVKVTLTVRVNESPSESQENSAGLGVERQAAILVDVLPKETSASQPQISGYHAALELYSGQIEDFIKLRAGNFGQSCDDRTENLRP